MAQFSWRTHGDTLTFTFGTLVEKWSYSINGQTLRLSDPSTGQYKDYERIDGESSVNQGQEATGQASGEIMYNGKTLVNWIGARRLYLWDEFGEPDYVGVVWEGDTEGCQYDGITFLQDSPGSPLGEDIFQIWGTKPKMFTIGGVSLDKNRNELVSLLGNPVDEGKFDNYGEAGYYMRYDHQETYSIVFYMNAPGDKAYELWIKR